MTPAEVLAAAADKLDALVAEATEGPWTAHYGSDLHTDAAAWIGAPGRATTDGVFVATTANAVEGLGDAAYIAAMNPLIGKALADYLRGAAHRLSSRPLDFQEVAADRGVLFDAYYGHALGLARLILGDESKP